MIILPYFLTTYTFGLFYSSTENKHRKEEEPTFKPHILAIGCSLDKDFDKRVKISCKTGLMASSLNTNEASDIKMIQLPLQQPTLSVRGPVVTTTKG